MTDGAVGDSNAVIEAAREYRDSIRVFTFGLGSGCDKHLVSKVASAGRGTYTIVKDGGEDLNGQVIRALQNAMEPSLKDVSFGWNDQPSQEDTEDIFRNQLVYSTKLIPAAELANIKFFFKTGVDPDTNQKIELNFARADFTEVQGATGQSLFKMAVFNELESKKKTDEERIAMSLKYQVLSEDTAIIGVCKQENKSSGEVQESTIEFGKSAAPLPEDEGLS